MVATKGREVRNIEEAEDFLREFIAETRRERKCGYDAHSYDYDLYLPWAFECVLDGGRPAGMSCHELSELFMDAGWSLVQKGYLRPGPRAIQGQDVANAQGKGYSLTPQGRAWIVR